MKDKLNVDTQRENFLVFGEPAIEIDEINEVVDSMRSGWIGTGPKVMQFESEFASYKGIDPSRVAAVNSCTAALQLSLNAASLDEGDEVITTPLTFCATVNAIIHNGATPVLADIDPDTMNIDPDMIKKVITSRTRAIVPVHFAGRPCNMDRIMDIAQHHDLKVIEDCAHAIETEFKNKKTGTFGDFGCFSFYVTKNLVTGEGGMIIAREQSDVDKIKVLALHGMTKDAWKRFSDSGFKHYKIIACGYKYNMMDIQAAIGIHQLRRLESNWKRRKEIWETYNNAFCDNSDVITPLYPEAGTKHAYHLYTLQLKNVQDDNYRDVFVDRMTTRKIGVGIHYLSIPEHPYYQDTFGWKTDDYPNAKTVGRRTISLPLSAKLTDQDIWDVISAVNESL